MNSISTRIIRFCSNSREMSRLQLFRISMWIRKQNYYIEIHTYTHTHTHTYIHTHTHTHTHTQIRTHTNIHTYTHTSPPLHTHTNTQTPTHQPTNPPTHLPTHPHTQITNFLSYSFSSLFTRCRRHDPLHPRSRDPFSLPPCVATGVPSTLDRRLPHSSLTGNSSRVPTGGAQNFHIRVGWVGWGRSTPSLSHSVL